MIDDDKPIPRRGRPSKPDKPTATERKRKSREKLAEKDGLARVEVLVPKDRAQDVRNYAARLRAEAGSAKEDED